MHVNKYKKCVSVSVSVSASASVSVCSFVEWFKCLVYLFISVSNVCAHTHKHTYTYKHINIYTHIHVYLLSQAAKEEF